MAALCLSTAACNEIDAAKSGRAVSLAWERPVNTPSG